jgi:selenide,water dikinase
LKTVLDQIQPFSHPDLLVGYDTSDDAGVYRVREDLAIIQTVDFFTPMVDDPRIFGEIAAANALSDIYAMGGSPVTALNIVGFPSCSLDIGILGEILAGGAAKVREAEALIVGGHTVEDKEPKYGLAVTGLIHPDHLVTNKGACPGDLLVLTKPIGTGVIATALKGDLADPQGVEEAVRVMTTLNRAASEAMVAVGVNACTDITGFGLLGHLAEMCLASSVGAELELSAIPFLPTARDLAGMGLLPGGAHRNRDYLSGRVRFTGRVEEAEADLLFDPQTSGGLLIAVAGKKAEQLLAKLKNRGVEGVIVGRLTRAESGNIKVRGRSFG